MVEDAGLSVLAVGGGGAAGALARYAVATAIERRALDTLLVNVLGSFILGIVLAAPVGETVIAAVGVGFSGAFTTFSSFAVETVRIAEEGERTLAICNAVGTLVFATVGVLLGSAVGVLV